MNSTSEIIKFIDIVKTYKMGAEDVHALRGVSLDIVNGEFVAITGPSGSGKSTLMHIIGLLDMPTSGEYVLRGEPVSRISGKKQRVMRNSEIGFVFQQFNLLPRTTVLDNVLLPTIYGSKRDSVKRAREVIDRVGLSKYSQHKSNQLSGGQVQRVAIARALMMEPSLILADEPTGNLDSAMSKEIMELFKSVNKEGATIVLITHEPDIAALADRTVRVFDGLIAEDGD